MHLNVRQVAGLLAVSEKTVYRWVRHSNLPAYRINKHFRFHRAELLEWATAHRINVAPDIFTEPEHTEIPVAGLMETLKTGGIYYRVEGTDKETVLQFAVNNLPLPPEVDSQFLLDVLIARESLGSTAIGDGIAIPHVRNPLVLHIPCPMIALCFLEQSIPFGALDGKPVHTLFTLVSPSISAHLRLLSRLSFALRQPEFVDVIKRQGSRQEILDAATTVDACVRENEVQPDARGAAST